MKPTKVTIPEELKSEMPHTGFGKLLAATPVVMAVVATMLAGLASSEMTKAQYDRAYGAQLQSKAGDQWSFFQAKRLRGAFQRNTVDLMQSTVEVHPLQMSALAAAAEQLTKIQASPEIQSQAATVRKDLQELLDSPEGKRAVELMQKRELPPGGATQPPPPDIKAAIDALDSMRSDAELANLLAKVDPKTLDAAVTAARDRSLTFDEATRPINQVIDRLDVLIGRLTALVGLANAEVASATRGFTAARLQYAAQRYEVEARLNQAIASLYELQVRKSNTSAERHHTRSQRFFFGMLAAQAGVIISTFAMAARQRNVLWALAAAAGILAVLFAIYVYLYV